MFDPRCADLARVFLESNRLATQQRVRELAQQIQDVIEWYLEGAKQAPPQPGDGFVEDGA